MRGKVVWRSGILLAVENEGNSCSLIQASRDQAEPGDILDWQEAQGDVEFINETRRTSFHSPILESKISHSQVLERLRALRN